MLLISHFLSKNIERTKLQRGRWEALINWKQAGIGNRFYGWIWRLGSWPVHRGWILYRLDVKRALTCTSGEHRLRWWRMRELVICPEKYCTLQNWNMSPIVFPFCLFQFVVSGKFLQQWRSLHIFVSIKVSDFRARMFSPYRQKPSHFQELWLILEIS